MLLSHDSPEDALVKAAALQGAIFNSPNLSLVATDATGVIQIFSAGAQRMLGYAEAEVVNQLTPVDISDKGELIARAAALSVELATPIAPGFAAIVGKASRGLEDSFELTHIRKDGSRLPAAVSVRALRDAPGDIIGYLLICIDNTVRHEAQAEKAKLDQRLRDQQFYTRSLFEANIDAIMTTDPFGIITDVNKQMESLTGRTRDELIGAPFRDCFTDPARAQAAIRQVLADKKVTDYELTAYARDGKETVVSYNATTFYDRDRNLQGVFAAARDVTAQKRAEVELKQAMVNAESANRTKSDFLASMSHEIRTPLNAIMGIAELLAKTTLTPEQDRFVQVFRRAGDNLLNLINDILDLSKVEASQLELERTGFSLPDLLEKVIEMVAHSAQEKGLVLRCKITADVPPNLIGDPTRLRQVLLNLLGNAIKFTAAGSISLRVTPDFDAAVPTALRFTISDTGIGIAGENLDRVFERFRQGDSSTTGRFGGSGLGLTISKRLVEAMGGRMWLRSEVDAGSVFSFAVPFEIWAGAPSRPSVAAGHAPADELPPLRILLVEDSADNRLVTEAYLAHTPYQLEIAKNGAIACEMFAATPYDLVLMDRQMPVMDGLEATRTIRAWEVANGRSPTPIIALTASALKGDRETCLAAGCTAFLTKPIRQDVLLQAIKDRALPPQPLVAGEGARAAPSLVGENALLLARVPAYLQHRRADVATMREALARGAFDVAEQIGHAMLGAGASFGFQAISDLGAGIELAARHRDASAVRGLVDELATYLERRAETAPVVTAAAAPAPEAASRVARSIVLVDDDDDIRLLFSDVLVRRGHHVKAARNGVDGVALIVAERPDVAIIDISLPGIDGYEVARQVRAALHHAVHLVAMTGHGHERDRLAALAAGFDAHMTKPIDMARVEAMLQGDI